MKRLISLKKLNYTDVQKEFEKLYPQYIFKSIESIDVDSNTIKINYSTIPEYGVVELPKDVSKNLIDKYDTSDWEDIKR